MKKIFGMLASIVIMALSISASADIRLPPNPTGISWDLTPTQFVSKCKSLGGIPDVKQYSGNAVFKMGVLCIGVNLNGPLRDYHNVIAGYLKSGHIGRLSYFSNKYDDLNTWKKHTAPTVVFLVNTYGKNFTMEEENLPEGMTIASHWQLTNGSIQHSVWSSETNSVPYIYDSVWFTTTEALNQMEATEDSSEPRGTIQM